MAIWTWSVPCFSLAVRANQLQHHCNMQHSRIRTCHCHTSAHYVPEILARRECSCQNPSHLWRSPGCPSETLHIQKSQQQSERKRKGGSKYTRLRWFTSISLKLLPPVFWAHSWQSGAEVWCSAAPSGPPGCFWLCPLQLWPRCIPLSVDCQTVLFSWRTQKWNKQQQSLHHPSDTRVRWCQKPHRMLRQLPLFSFWVPVLVSGTWNVVGGQRK